tara:strand:- start:128 stop:499 length:372 start_codon:yes stop_codon:yes gene_type:complete
MEIYTLSSQPYYCSINKCYRKILVLNKKPEGPLLKISSRINPPKISPFKTKSICCPNPHCIWVIKNPENSCNLMCIDELPLLFQFLLNNGYIIDTSITEMMNKSSVKLEFPLICYISYKIDKK